MNHADLRTGLDEHLSAVVPPEGDLTRALREGRLLRRRRTAGRVGAGTAAALIVVAGLLRFTGGPGSETDGRVLDPVGRLDFSSGLRAYADPGGEIHLGGRVFEPGHLPFLDTDAIATGHGIVFYDGGLPQLLDETGHVTALEHDEPDPLPGFHPTAQADSTESTVAYAVARDGGVTVTVFDLAGEPADDSADVSVVARRDLACEGGCDDVVIDALDGGAVFIRTAEGTFLWDTGSDTYDRVAGPASRIVDVRNGVVLYDGAVPDRMPDDWRLVRGPVDAQLTFDGGHVLDWSSRLRPTSSGERALVLDEGPTDGDGLAWWAIDTDGSVLVAESVDYPRSIVYDCAVPSGSCTRLGPLTTTSGDPMFIGNDE